MPTLVINLDSGWLIWEWKSADNCVSRSMVVARPFIPEWLSKSEKLYKQADVILIIAMHHVNDDADLKATVRQVEDSIPEKYKSKLLVAHRHLAH